MASASKPIGISPSIGHAAMSPNRKIMNNIRNIPPKQVDRKSSPLFILFLFLSLSYSMPTFLWRGS